ncbi:hypothetical protein ACA910_012447 [Epithemia clementina (nom. ined.)]
MYRTSRDTIFLGLVQASSYCHSSPMAARSHVFLQAAACSGYGRAPLDEAAVILPSANSESCRYTSMDRMSRATPLSSPPSSSRGTPFSFWWTIGRISLPFFTSIHQLPAVVDCVVQSFASPRLEDSDKMDQYFFNNGSRRSGAEVQGDVPTSFHLVSIC